MRRRHLIGVATVAGLLLVSGPVTGATLTDSVSSATVGVVAANLTVGLSSSGPVSTTRTQVPSVVAPPGDGIVPGVQGQQWTHTVTNTSAVPQPASRAQLLRAQLRIRVSGSPTTANQAAWDAVRPHLVLTLTPAAGAPVTVPRSAFTAAGLDFTTTLTGALAPGADRTVTLLAAVPAVGVGGEDLPLLLAPFRSQLATPSALLPIAYDVTLVQLPAGT